MTKIFTGGFFEDTGVDALEPVVEPAELCLVQFDTGIGRQNRYRRHPCEVGASIGEAGAPRDRRGVFCGGARLRGHGMLTQTAEVCQATTQEDVIPGGDVVHRHVDVGELSLHD